MAQHTTKYSMQKEALKELIEVAEFCINYQKNRDNRWVGYEGCYGYPAALILLSIVDSVGSIIKGGGDDSRIHFSILNDPDYYNLNINDNEIEIFRNDYRNKLSHNSCMEIGIGLMPGFDKSNVLEYGDGNYWINLKPFLDISKKVVDKILNS